MSVRPTDVGLGRFRKGGRSEGVKGGGGGKGGQGGGSGGGVKGGGGGVREGQRGSRKGGPKGRNVKEKKERDSRRKMILMKNQFQKESTE